MRPILFALIILFPTSLRADNSGTEFTPYNHKTSEARLRAALNFPSQQSTPQHNQHARRPKYTYRQQQSTYFRPPVGYGRCVGPNCPR